jgi:RimJ/RimL family protein N-acetyltransferase
MTPDAETDAAHCFLTPFPVDQTFPTARIPDPPAETERLRFRRWTRCDQDRLAYFRLMADPEVMTYIDPTRRFRSVPDIDAFLANDPPFEAHGYGFWLVEWRESGEAIGTIGMKAKPQYGWVEFGYLFKRAYWGRGIATEAAAAVLSWADAAGVTPLYARVLPDNEASVRVLQRAGFSFVRVGPPEDDFDHVYVRHV